MMRGVEEVIETALRKYIILGLVHVAKNPLKNGGTERVLFVHKSKKSQI